ncbi:MAG TPA: DUF5690 family protein, partial [Chitinophagaceae bacterium]|nr:DUF5690 family protein [Chitinophagaceae bacterium]
MHISKKWKEKLSGMPAWFIALYAALCAFGVYFCMYAFRKPFTAAGFEGIKFLTIDYKVWLVTAQVVGYMLSKFFGIRFISAMKTDKRAAAIVKLILLAWLALLLFGIVPAPYNIIFLFAIGLPLGMVWGLVFGYLEGRSATEFMGAVVRTSFIFSSGVVKTVGKSIVLYWHVSEIWMPFVAGALFVLPMILFTWLLNHIPAPSEKDIQLRSIRKPMTKDERAAFIKTFLPGIIIIVATYVLLTVLRDFRDNFANELYKEMGYGNDASIFTVTETYVSLIVLLCMGLLALVKNNMRAFLINHYIIMAGFALALVSTLLFANHFVSPVLWMVLVGTGLYLSYVPFNALYFERMIASYRISANVGFIMYISDAFGYLGSV